MPSPRQVPVLSPVLRSPVSVHRDPDPDVLLAMLQGTGIAVLVLRLFMRDEGRDGLRMNQLRGCGCTCREP